MPITGNYSRKFVFAAACIGMAFFGISLTSLGAVLPSLSAKFNLDDLGASSVVTFLPAGILLGSLVFGPFVDRFGYKFLLIFSSLITIVGLGWIGYAESLPAVRIAIFLTGFGGGILNGETNTLVSDISNDDRNANLSLLGIFFGIGALGIPALMGILSRTYAFETILIATSVFMLLIAIAFFFIRFPLPKQAQGFPVKDGIKLLKQPLLLLLSFILFFHSGLEGLTNNWTTTYLEKAVMLPKEKALFALTLMVLGMTVTRLVLGVILKKIKSYIVLITGFCIVLLGIIILMVDPIHDIIGITLLGIGFAPVFPVILGYIGTLYSDLSGTAFGIALFIALTGNTTLNLSMGVVAKKFGIDIFPLALLLLLAIMSVILFILLKKESFITKVK